MDTYELHSRVGQFNIPDNWVKDDPAELMQIMSKMIVIRCEHLYHKGYFSYTALSPLFDKIEDGEYPPYYFFIILEGEVKAKQIFPPGARGKIEL